MTDTQQKTSSPDNASTCGKSQRAQFRRFCSVSLAFLAGFLLAGLLLDAAIGNYLRRTNRRGGLGGEVQAAIERVDKKSDEVRIIFVGDSVSHQLFKPPREPNPSIRFMTSNVAITTAGQCYMAEGAFKRCPHITDVYLFCLPAAWRNNMPRAFTHDYLCGHFHSASQVIEVFKAKRDIELSFAHAGRWLWPNIMAANSLSRPAFAMQPDARATPQTAADVAAQPPDPERLLTLLSQAMAPPPEPIPQVPPGQEPVYLSPISRYYLTKLQRDCQQRGIRLHVLPCPVSQEKNHQEFVDPNHIYDAPIINDIPAEQLIDAVHFKAAFVPSARKRVIEQYNLDFLK